MAPVLAGIALMSACLATGSAAVAVCPVPDLQPADGAVTADNMARSRDRVSSYVACLRDQRDVLGLLDPDAARRLDLQLDAAAQLERTLDAWIAAQDAAAARDPAL